MTDNINKNIDNEELELDLDRLEGISGGGSFDQLKAIAQQTFSKECDSNYNDIKKRLDRIENKLKSTNNH